MSDINRHIISQEATLREAFSKLNLLSGDNMTLFAVDADRVLVGSLTDGDLRRAITSGRELDSRVADCCRRDCMTAGTGDERYAKVSEARRRGVSLLPIIDNGRLTGLLDLRHIKTVLPIDAVLMAGGRGERLRPLTLTTPKPLLKVGEKAIIDHNVDELMACGVDNIYVTVNYLKEQIIRHFADARYAGRVRCIEEPKRLGTMGSLALCPGLRHDTVLVMNSDLLTSLSFEKMWLRHIENGNALTMAAVPYTVSVPFAIVEADGLSIKGLTEKPIYNYFANAGVYMMRRDIAEAIPEDEYLDAPDLVTQLIEKGEKVEYFPIDGRWIDIGSPDDYRQACLAEAGR